MRKDGAVMIRVTNGIFAVGPAGCQNLADEEIGDRSARRSITFEKSSGDALIRKY